MGANSYVWSIRHTRLHHNYPNIMGWDSDVEQSSLARIFPLLVPLSPHANTENQFPLPRRAPPVPGG